jgi:hypothetical protein
VVLEDSPQLLQVIIAESNIPGLEVEDPLGRLDMSCVTVDLNPTRRVERETLESDLRSFQILIDLIRLICL